ncbi:MAG TPA: plasmid partitioning protein RepB [Pararhizobium sp.]|uniref:plasmid partitioning protein RepB n=1 Tax=Pararhizobium sp. TaxID=1977563 RepID=UPI002CB8F65A|nr:plasmid partitioning protein RepB [Pararhizobium sp.]HTO34180.1 plasmid partitioning protein RepB [Pararhizobium sp.]
MVNPKERNLRMKSLFGNVDPEALNRQAAPSPSEAEKKRVGSAAVKSMDRAFVSIEDENKRLHDQLLSSESIIELDPERIIPSFVNDRLDIEGDNGFQAFVEGIREAGQKLPILVRPLPGKPGHYQAAYGHRRLRACQILKRPVKAIVRDLSDEELVISQGIENSERLNLSFIEQALFALKLKERGYSRETISDALGRKEGQRLAYISILTNTVSLIPDVLIRQIGPASSIGRPKWEKLGALIHDRKLSARQSETLKDLTASAAWLESDSDQRFSLVLDAFDQTSRRKPDLVEVSVAHGIIIVAKRADSSTRISIPDNRLPGLSDWLLQRLPELVEEFQQKQGKGSAMT